MMTREAKVGLLLGLAFIIAIAMVLRGIHQTSRIDIEDELLVQRLDADNTSTANESVNLSAVNQLTDVRDDESRAESAGYQVRRVQPAASSSSGVVEPTASSYVTRVMPSANEPDIRYEQALPQPAMGESHSVIPPDSQIDRALDRLTEPAVAPTVVHAATIVKPESSKIYQVQKGDDLSRIAMKVYGPQEGNRWVNIKRIYDTNRKVLSSMDEVRVGQTLAIPPLKNAPLPPPTVSSPAKIAPAPAKTATYVVKEGDSLWKIAQIRLGNGNRYPEIVKLNVKTLKDQNNLWVGMQLTMPAK